MGKICFNFSFYLVCPNSKHQSWKFERNLKSLILFLKLKKDANFPSKIMIELHAFWKCLKCRETYVVLNVQFNIIFTVVESVINTLLKQKIKYENFFILTIPFASLNIISITFANIGEKNTSAHGKKE